MPPVRSHGSSVKRVVDHIGCVVLSDTYETIRDYRKYLSGNFVDQVQNFYKDANSSSEVLQ